ncbi:endonuclease III domain-containing protein [candidate division WOR-3 bacterium]|nr:endonuclease III domain-containing protein [candidate division WOR-3 bacterium]
MKSNRIYSIYQTLLSSLGPRDWWPADTPFEVMVGAILTQNTNWGNVEKAILNLKKFDLLTPEKLTNCSIDDLSLLLKPAGYHNIKSNYLKNFSVKFLEDYNGNISELKQVETSKLRGWLLSIKGIGEETADSILIYALGKKVFVVDAYTKRILLRHDIIKGNLKYREIQSLVEKNLPRDSYVLGEFHALLVEVGKCFCRKEKPLCKNCPLSTISHY